MVTLENHTYPAHAMKITFGNDGVRIKLNADITSPDDVSKILSLVKHQEVRQTLRSVFANIPKFIAGGYVLKLVDTSKPKKHLADYSVDTQTITYVNTEIG